MTAQMRKILIHLIKLCEAEPPQLRFQPDEIAQELHLNPVTVGNALRRLADARLLRPIRSQKKGSPRAWEPRERTGYQLRQVLGAHSVRSAAFRSLATDTFRKN